MWNLIGTPLHPGFVISCAPQTEETVLGPEFRKKWAKLQSILERQREKGGVIDPEAESNRFLIHINQVRA